jgi:hypothetical protein
MWQSNLALLANYLCCLDFCSPLGSANYFRDLGDEHNSLSNTCPINVSGQRCTAATARPYRMLWRQSGQLGCQTRIDFSIETVSSE